MAVKAANTPNPEAWGLPGFFCEPLIGGARNTVLRGTGLGQGFVFKTTSRTESQLHWLRHVQVVADRAGLTVALPVATQSHQFANEGWTMEPYVAGRPATDQDLKALSPRIDAFHSVARHTPQRPGFASARALIHTVTSGDIDLARMPDPLVLLFRTAWSLLPDEASTLIHADLTPQNLIITSDGTPVLLDWDEARVDLPAFDRNALGDETDLVTQTAALAFEIAACWCIEPMRARRLARDLPKAVVLAQSS